MSETQVQIEWPYQCKRNISRTNAEASLSKLINYSSTFSPFYTSYLKDSNPDYSALPALSPDHGASYRADC